MTKGLSTEAKKRLTQMVQEERRRIKETFVSDKLSDLKKNELQLLDEIEEIYKIKKS